jgi:hypothetical protein
MTSYISDGEASLFSLFPNRINKLHGLCVHGAGFYRTLDWLVKW